MKKGLTRFRPVKRLARIADKIRLPGFEGFSLLQTGRFFFAHIGDVNLNERVAAVTYNLVMALPPTMLFLFSLVPYLPLTGVEDTILSTIRLIIPNSQVSEGLTGIVSDFMNNKRTDLLSFGVLMTLFFSSNGMMGLMRSFDRSLAVYKKRTDLKRRWTAIKLTFLLILVVILTIAVLIIQSEMLNVWLMKLFGNPAVIRLFSLLLMAGIIFSAISLIYTYGPSLTHRFPFISPGSVFATGLIIIVTTIFFYLVNNFINYNQIYGSIGTLIALMVWMWLNTLIILLGYELNITILLGKISRDENES